MSWLHPDRVAALDTALANRILVLDGAMGTMLQAADPSMEDFQQLEGCNEILNETHRDEVLDDVAAFVARVAS